jgi:HAMP domain-containing protein
MEKRSYLKSLRGKITTQMLLISLVPILIIGGLAYFSLNRSVNDASDSLQQSRDQLAEEVVGANLNSEATLIAREIDQFMLERMGDVIVWSTAPVVVETAQQGFALAEEQGLPQLSLDEQEATMEATRTLAVDQSANNYLKQQIDLSPHFGEVFFTDAHGYNVAVTSPTSDFVQSDEDWWQEAWENQISIGTIEYDDSAGIWSIEISVRVDHPQTGAALGVMKSVLGVSLLQEVADLHESQLQEGDVTILNPEGLLVAETASAHELERIMNPEISLLDIGSDAVTDVFASEDASGFNLSDDLVSGFSRTNAAAFYESIPGFDGFGWAVLVDQPTEVAFAPIQSLSELESDLDNSRQTIGLTILVVVLLVAVGALTLAFFLSSGITVPILHLRDVAEKVSRGDLNASISVKSDDEIGDLANAFGRMVTAIRFFAAEDDQESVEV